MLHESGDKGNDCVTVPMGFRLGAHQEEAHILLETLNSILPYLNAQSGFKFHKFALPIPVGAEEKECCKCPRHECQWQRYLHPSGDGRIRESATEPLIKRLILILVLVFDNVSAEERLLDVSNSPGNTSNTC